MSAPRVRSVLAALALAWFAASPVAVAASPERVADPALGDGFQVRKPGVWLVEDRRRPAASILRKLPLHTPVQRLADHGAWWKVETLDGSNAVGWVLATLLTPAWQPLPTPSPVAALADTDPERAVEAAVVAPKPEPMAPMPDGARATIVPSVGAPAPLPITRPVVPEEGPVGSSEVTPLASPSPSPPWTSAALWLLLLLAALGVGTWWVSRRPRGADIQGAGLEVMRNVALDRGTRLALVRAADRFLVISCSGTGMSLLANTPAAGDDGALDVSVQAAPWAA